MSSELLLRSSQNFFLQKAEIGVDVCCLFVFPLPRIAFLVCFLMHSGCCLLQWSRALQPKDMNRNLKPWLRKTFKEKSPAIAISKPLRPSWETGSKLLQNAGGKFCELRGQASENPETKFSEVQKVMFLLRNTKKSLWGRKFCEVGDQTYEK